MPFKPVDTNIKVILGPCIDDTDFKSREEGLTYNQAGLEIDVILEKADGTISTTAVVPTTAGNYDWAHTNQGYYELELIATGGVSYNNDTEGILRVVGYCTGVLPFSSVAYNIVPIKVYNSLVAGSDNLEVDTIQISSDATAADNAELAYDGTGFGFTNCTMPTTTTLTNANPTVASIADGVWDEVKSGHVGTTTFGDLATDLDTVAVDVAGLDGAAMRGTDSAALATVCTEARLSELDAGTAGKAAAEVDIIKAAQLGVNTWYVTKGGNDANGGKKWTDAFLTVTAAITASTSKDTIYLGPGTFTEVAVINLLGASKTLTFIGSGKAITVISCDSTSSTITAFDNCTFKYLTISNANETGAALQSGDVPGIIAEDCIFSAPTAMLCVGPSNDNHTYLRCRFSGYVSIGNTTGFLAEDCFFNYSASGAYDKYGVLLSTSSSRFRFDRCRFRCGRGDNVSNLTVAVGIVGDVYFNSCDFYAKSTNVSATGAVQGVAEVSNNLLAATLHNCKIYTSNAGSGGVKDIVQTSGTIAASNTLYNRTNVTGTVQDLTQDAVVSDATRYLGADIATIKGYTDILDDATNGNAAIKAEVEGLAGAAMRGTDSAALASVCTELRLAELDAANLPTDIAAILADTGTDGVVIPSAEEAAIADAVWDELTSGHTTVGSYGQRLQAIRTGTAQAGAAGTITLDASASAVDDFYKNALVLITAGTGANQVRTISAYVGSTKIATITPNWGTTPGATSVFVIIPMGAIAGASAPTAADVADAVWDEVKSGHTGTTTFGDLATDIDTIAGASAPTVGQIDTELTTNHGSGSWQRSTGTGASSKTYTVTDSVTGLPIDGVTVWVTSDSAGNTVLASGTTNASGVFTWYHDLAASTTVYVWCQKSGYNFSNPDTETI